MHHLSGSFSCNPILWKKVSMVESYSPANDLADGRISSSTPETF
jgi:hypothetical protein